MLRVRGFECIHEKNWVGSFLHRDVRHLRMPSDVLKETHSFPLNKRRKRQIKVWIKCRCTEATVTHRVIRVTRCALLPVKAERESQGRGQLCMIYILIQCSRKHVPPTMYPSTYLTCGAIRCEFQPTSNMNMKEHAKCRQHKSRR